jgi:Protein of unknown function (DUF559)
MRSDAVAALGIKRVKTALASGTLVALWPRVLVDGSRRLELLTRAAAALLTVGPDAVLCGLTAARLHGCTAASTSPIHVLMRYEQRMKARAELRVHRGWLSDDDVTEIEGLPVLALDRTIADLLCSHDRREALACADQAVALHPESRRAMFIAAVGLRLDQRRDRRGTRQAADLLRLVDGRTESPPESWLRLLVVEAGFPPPAVQYSIFDRDGALVYRLDLAWPEIRIALEYDGYEAHVGRQAQDAARDADLARRGWLTVRAAVDDLRNPRRLLDELTRAFRERHVPLTGLRLAAAG